MAQIKSHGLKLEIKFTYFEYDWINYDIKFYWKDEIIIKDSILKRMPEGWSKRSYGTFLANDYQKDYLIDVIKKALETDESICWEPMEPDAILAIYPRRFFPFVETPYNFFKELEDIRRKEEQQGKTPEDLFTIITFIDQYNFKNSPAYQGEGISLHLVVERQNLEKFLADLEKEYNDLKSKINVEKTDKQQINENN